MVRDDERAHAHSGEDAVQIFGRFDGGPNFSGLWQSMVVGPGEFLEASVFAAPRPGDEPQGTNYGRIKLEFLDAGQGFIETRTLRTMDANSPAGYDWFALRQRAPANTAEGRIVIEYFQDNDDGGSMNVDDAGLRLVGAFGDRPLLNGDFEWGVGNNLANWTIYPPSGNVLRETGTSNIHAGDSAVQLFGQFDGMTNFTGLFQDVPAKPGELWEAGVWAKSRTGDEITGMNETVMKLEFTDFDGAVLQVSTTRLADATTPNSWTSNRTLTAIAPNNTYAARIVLEFQQRNDAPGSVVIDDVSFRPLSPEGELLNADLEIYTATSFPGWAVYSEGFNVIRDPVSQNARSGTNAVQMFGRFTGGPNESGMFQDLPAQQGQVWQARVWARNRPGDGPEGMNRGIFKIEFFDGGNGLLAGQAAEILDAGSSEAYEEFILKMSAPTNTTTARVVLGYVQENNDNGSINFDDARFGILTPDDERPMLNGGFEDGVHATQFMNMVRYPLDANIIHDPNTNNARSGTEAVQMFGLFNGMPNTEGLFQDFPARPGEVWQASVWARNRPGDPATMNNHARLKIEFVDDLDVLLVTNQLAIIDATSPQTYERFTIRRQAPPGTTRARMVLEHVQDNDAGGSINFDDAEMKPVTADDPDRVLLNGDFEQGEGAEFANWIRYSPAMAATNIFRDPLSSNAYSGAVALQMHGAYDGTTNNQSGIFQNIPAREGELWQAGVWGRNRPGDRLQGDNRVWLKLEFIDASGGLIVAHEFVILDASSPETYTWFGIRYPAPAGTALARMVLQIDQINLADGSVNLDLADLRMPTAPEEPPLINGGFDHLYPNGDFVNWVEYGNGNNVVTDDVPGHALSGQSVKMFGTFGSPLNASGLYQDIPALNGQIWSAAVWAGNRPGDLMQGNNVANLKLEFIDADGAVISATVLPMLTAASPTNYQRFEIIGSAPPGTRQARMVMEFIQDNFAGGAAVFDQATFTPLPVVSGTQDVGRIRMAGRLYPGLAEAVVVPGDLELDTGLQLHQQIAGDAPGLEFDQIRVGGNASIDGALHLDVPIGLSSESTATNLFIPRKGDRFPLLVAPAVSGLFSSVTGPDGVNGNPAFQVLTFSTAVVAVVAHEIDSDQDNLPDFWELQHFGSVNAGNAIIDSDGDTMDNLSELIAGTDPTNGLAVFQIDALLHDGTNAMLSWPSVSGKFYHV
ncbi:MAG: hypothetical protein AAF492_03015, partial [Verrucomicrobiota bacterium]